MGPTEWTEDVVGQTLGGRYRVDEVIGAGGMGAVFEAVHTGTSRRVAIKVLVPSLRDHPKAHKRFQIEAQAAAATSRRGVVEVIDFDVDEEVGPYLVMELLEGESLEHRIKRSRRLDEDEALGIVSEMLDTLEAVHEEGIVHRDLKPANIFLARTPEGGEVVKILDFGISRVLRATDGTQLTTPGMAVGTPRYMSPEQAQCDPDVDRRADLYSVGAILYEMLSGTRPYDDVFPGRVLAEVILRAPRPLAEVAPELRQPLVDLVARAMRRDREERFGSASEMGAAVKALRRGLGLEPAAGGARDEVVRAEPLPTLRQEAAVAAPAEGLSLGRSSSSPGAKGEIPSWPAPELAEIEDRATGSTDPEPTPAPRARRPSRALVVLSVAIVVVACSVAAGAFVLGERILHPSAASGGPEGGLERSKAAAVAVPGGAGSGLEAELRSGLEAARRELAAGQDNAAEHRANELVQRGYAAGVRAATPEGRLLAETHLLLSDIFLERILTPPAPADPAEFASLHDAVTVNVAAVTQQDRRAMELDDTLSQCALYRNGQAAERLANVYHEMASSPAYRAVMYPAVLATFPALERAQLDAAYTNYGAASRATHGVVEDCSALVRAAMARVAARRDAVSP